MLKPQTEGVVIQVWWCREKFSTWALWKQLVRWKQQPQSCLWLPLPLAAAAASAAGKGSAAVQGGRTVALQGGQLGAAAQAQGRHREPFASAEAEHRLVAVLRRCLAVQRYSLNNEQHHDQLLCVTLELPVIKIYLLRLHQR